MTLTKLVFPTFRISAPKGWLDGTHNQKPGGPVTILERKGVGAYQVSVGLYISGRPPRVVLTDLLDMLTEFAKRRKLGHSFDEMSADGTLKVAGGSFHRDGDFIRAWYASDGNNVALITYLCTLTDRPLGKVVLDNVTTSLEFAAAEHAG